MSFPFPRPFPGPSAMVSYSVLSLFMSGEQGAWYDPSDFSTMFQDSAGTTPVTAVEQPVGLLLDKSKGLALGSELVTNGDFSNGSTGWTISGGGVSITGGALTASTASTANIYSTISPSSTTRTFKVSWTITSATAGDVILRLYNAGANVAVSGFSYLSAAGTYTAYVQTNATPNQAWITLGGAGFTGSIDNISVRELPGNHASQSTAASRPVLSARVNLLTRTEEFASSAWTLNAQGTGVIPTRTAPAGTDPNGGNTATRLQVSRSGTATTDRSGIYQSATAVSANTDHTAAVWLKSYSGATQKIVLYANWGAGLATEVTVTNIWQRFSISLNTGASTTARLDISLGFAVSTETSADILLWGADLRVTNAGVNLPAYQRVAAATDYDTSGFPLYLKFDGTDDSLSTASIDFSATDKMSVFAGVRKLSDAAEGFIVELSDTLNAGTFRTYAPRGGATNFSWRTGGSSFSEAAATYTAPVSAVVTGVGNISADVSTLRVNGVQAATNAADQGTGNFGNYPLYIGRRNNASSPLNGNLYSLIVRGALSTDAQIASTEAWVNGKTGAY